MSKKSSVTVITPTGDRKESLLLLAKKMMQQTFLQKGVIHWIVVDDGESLAAPKALAEIGDSALSNANVFTYYVKRARSKGESGPESLGKNLLQALSYTAPDPILIMEDDDHYFPRHVEDLYIRLGAADIVGTVWQKYYHLPSKSYKVFRNRGSALCSTGFRWDLIPVFKKCIEDSIKTGSKGIDAKFWAATAKEPYIQNCYEPKRDTCIGMKGLPGRFGIGVGHKPKGFFFDPNFKVLREWCGNFADDYIRIYEEYFS